jgi:uncharacterized membrane protein
MTLLPLLQSTWAVQIHVVALMLAWLVGTWQFSVSRKGGVVHQTLGRVFVALMLTVALVSLFIHVRAPHSAFFGFSRLHLYVPVILTLCALAIYGARTHRIRLHRFAVIALYFGSLLFTGLVQIFLATGGITHRMFFSSL